MTIAQDISLYPYGPGGNGTWPIGRGGGGGYPWDVSAPITIEWLPGSGQGQGNPIDARPVGEIGAGSGQGQGDLWDVSISLDGNWPLGSGQGQGNLWNPIAGDWQPGSGEGQGNLIDGQLVAIVAPGSGQGQGRLIDARQVGEIGAGSGQGQGDLWDVSVSGGGGAFDPADMFGSGEDGCLFLPSDSTCYTDDSNTTLVASNGDDVASMDDLSGNANHMAETGAGQHIIFGTGSGRNWLTQRADSGSSFLSFASNPLAAASAAYAIYACDFPSGLPPSVNQFGPLFDTGLGDENHLPASSGQAFVSFYSDARVWFGGYGSLGTALHIVELVNDGSDLEVYVDRTQIGSTQAITWDDTATPKLFHDVAIGGVRDYEGRIFGFLMIDRIPTGDELSDLRDFFEAL